MNRIFDLTRRLWAALLALCLVLALTLPVFAEGRAGPPTPPKRRPSTSAPSMTFAAGRFLPPGQLEQKPHRLSGRRSGTDRQRLCGHPVLQRRI
ncbi:hypothetical protein NIA69_10690 [Gemmiger formicilis]|nr:hypothetical protein [Gemmiger formicilis]